MVDELRLILLGLGLLVIAGIYLWGMRSRIRAGLEARKRRAAARLPENEPVLNTKGRLPDPDDDRTLGELDGDDDVTADAIAYQQPGEPTLGEEPEMTVVLTVIPPASELFGGRRILEVALQQDLRLNARSGTLDYLYPGEAADQRLFRIAHLREPGMFNVERIDDLETPGLLMFMHLPGPVDSIAAAEIMLDVAMTMALELGGQVCDQHHNRMSPQATEHLRSEAAEFERCLRVWNQNAGD